MSNPYLTNCPRCGHAVDLDLQMCTACSDGLVLDDIRDPFTDENHIVAYCMPCGIAEFGLGGRRAAS